MTDDTDLILAALQGRPKVRILQGTFVGATASGCTVDISGNRVPATLGTAFIPEVNEVVWVWRIGTYLFVMGPVAAKPDRGTVVSVSSGLVTMTTSLGGTLVSPFTGATPSAGQVMKILWQNGPIAVLMSTSPPGNTPPPAPTPQPTQHTDYFPSIDAGSYGSGRWWTNLIYGSDSNLGAWFYGSKIADTIPASAQIRRVQLWVPPGSQISGAAPNFAVHPHQTKPGGAPSLSTVAAVAISGGYVDLPVSIGNALKAGGGSAGVGLNHGGYNILRSRDQDGQSGQLVITSVY